ncbi:hypothetical protein FRB94_007887 [Tulasnella sp. JGI-2019a]|nr:hypothetical protein FRB94_007887 [Tulasnella sp. JGI-2019a]
MLIELCQVATDTDSHLQAQAAVDIDDEWDPMLHGVNHKLSNIQHADWEVSDDVSGLHEVISTFRLTLVWGGPKGFNLPSVLPLADNWDTPIIHDYEMLRYQDPEGLGDVDLDPLDNDFDPDSFFPSEDNEYTHTTNADRMLSHLGREGQGPSRSSLKRKGSADGLQDEMRKKTSTMAEFLKTIEASNDRVDLGDPEEKEVIEYMEKNPAKKPYKIAKDLAPLDPLRQRRIYKIAQLRLKTHTTPAEDKYILEYYTRNSHFRREVMIKALCRDLPRLNKNRIQMIMRYLDYFRGGLKESEESRLPGSKVVRTISTPSVAKSRPLKELSLSYRFTGF